MEPAASGVLVQGRGKPRLRAALYQGPRAQEMQEEKGANPATALLGAGVWWPVRGAQRLHRAFCFSSHLTSSLSKS